LGRGNISTKLISLFIRYGHTSYSLGDGVTRIEDLIKRLKVIGADACGVTEHGNMSSFLKFYKAAKANKIKPIIGCCLPEQLVYTLNGVKQIKDIQIGDFVLTHTGQYQKVINTMTRNYNGLIYGINSVQNNIVWLTDEHPVAVSDNCKNYNWIRADKLIPSEKYKSGGYKKNNKKFVLFPKLKYNNSIEINLMDYLDKNVFESENNNYIVKNKIYNKYDRKIHFNSVRNSWLLDENDYYVFGLYLVKGNLIKSKTNINGICFSFNSKEIKYIDFIKKYFKKFDIDAKVYEGEKKNQTSVHINSIVFGNLFFKLFGEYSDKKQIPSFVYKARKIDRKKMLEGIIDGDGSKSKNNISLKITNQEIVYFTKQICSELGYYAKVREKQYGKNKKFYIITYCENPKYRRFKQDENYIYSILSEIKTKKYNGNVHNLEVENDNSYVCDFIVHNCELYLNDLYYKDNGRFLELKRLKAENITESEEDADEEVYVKNETEADNCHFLAYATNYDGVKNLIHLSNKGYENFYRKPLIGSEHILQYLTKENNVITTGCLKSPFNRLILQDKEKEAEKLLLKYKDVYEENFYTEIQLNGIEIQNLCNDFYLRMYKKHKIKPVFALDYHYAEKDDWYIQYLLYMIKGKNTVSQQSLDNWIYKVRDLYIKEIDVIYQLAEENKLDKDFLELAIDSTFEIRDKTNIEIPMKNHYPKFTTSTEESERLFNEKLELKWKEKISNGMIPSGAIEEYRKRLDYEKNIVLDKGFVDYFLILDDLLNNYVYANGGTTGVGRGCFTPDMPIRMIDGTLKNISEVMIGEEVKNKQYGKATIEHKFEYDIDEDIVQLEFEDGFVMRLTKDHEIETDRGMIKAIDLTEQDNIIKL
jgi:hypothetical protein